MRKAIILFLIHMLVVGTISKTKAQCDIQPQDYTYSMQMIAVLNFGNVESTDEADAVYAYINGECRGNVSLAFDSGLNRYFAYLTIFSNQVEGDEVTLKIYDASADVLYTSDYQLTFEAMSMEGSASHPIQLFDTTPAYTLQLSNDSVSENAAIGTLIGKFNLSPEPSGSKTYELVEGENYADEEFKIEGNALYTQSAFNFDEEQEYTIRVKASRDQETYDEREFSIFIKEVQDSIVVPIYVYDTVRVEQIVYDTVRVEHIEIDTVRVEHTVVDTVRVQHTEIDTVFVEYQQTDTVLFQHFEVDTVHVNQYVTDTTYVDYIVTDTTYVQYTHIDTIRIEHEEIDTVFTEYHVEIYTIPDTTTVDVIGGESVKMRMFPNPAQDYLQIETTSDISKVSLYTTSGATVESWNPYSNEASLQLVDLDVGVYILEVFFVRGSIRRKLVISR